MSYADAMRDHRKAESDKELAGMMPPHNHTETSIEAAERVAPHVTDQEQRVLNALLAHGPQTRKELVESAGLGENTINARANKLLEKKLVHEDGKRDKRAILHYGPKP